MPPREADVLQEAEQERDSCQMAEELIPKETEPVISEAIDTPVLEGRQISLHPSEI